MSDDRWTHTTWYATRLHIFGETRPAQRYSHAHDVSLCGHYVESIEAHQKRHLGSTPPYSSLPHCKLCERKASTS